MTTVLAQRLTTNDIYTTRQQAAVVADLSAVGATLGTAKAARTALGFIATFIDLSASSGETVFSADDWSVVEAVNSGTDFKWKAEFLAAMIVASDIGRTLKLVQDLIDEGGDKLLQKTSREGFGPSPLGLSVAARVRGSVQSIRWLVKEHRIAQPYLLAAQVPLIASRIIDAPVTDQSAALSFADDVQAVTSLYLLEKMRSADYSLRPPKILQNFPQLDMKYYNHRCRPQDKPTAGDIQSIAKLLEAAT